MFFAVWSLKTLFDMAWTIAPTSFLGSTFGIIAYSTFSPGMEIVLGQPHASRAGALSDLTRDGLKKAMDADIYSIRSRSVSLKHISKAMTTHILTGNFAIPSNRFTTAKIKVTQTWNYTTNSTQRTSRTWDLQKAPCWQCGWDYSRDQTQRPPATARRLLSENSNQ